MEPTSSEANKQQELLANILQKIQKIVDTYIPKKYLAYLSNKKLLSIAGGVLFLLIIIPIFLLISSAGRDTSTVPTTGATPTPKQTDNIKKAAQPTPATKKSSQTLVYGTWTSQTSVVRAVDIATSTPTTIATLPLTVKKVSILSNNSLLYIDQTDSNDYGQRISVFNIEENQIVTNIPVDSGFGIDDYILSPNKHYLVLWEAKLSTETQTLQGGASRVYSVDLTQPATPNLLYDETATTTIPIHYPRAILDSGRVFTDQMIPNDPRGGAGWAYGMSIVDFDGSNKQDISTMTNGTYGSQPSLSPDGKYLLFAGYDGTKGDGAAVKNGYRQALLTPNTVELLDTKTLQRYGLPNLADSNTYSDVQWDKQSGNVIISTLSPDTKQMGIYSYDLGKLHNTQISLPSANGTPYGYVSQLPSNKTLIGLQSTDSANLGNLGPSYSYAYTQLATVDEKGKLSYLSLQDPFAQYITILPQNYFKGVLGTHTKALDIPAPTAATTLAPTGTNSNSQLYTFFLKTTLASHRLQIKSTPLSSALTCQNLGAARCAALGLTPQTSAYVACQNTEKATSATLNACY